MSQPETQTQTSRADGGGKLVRLADCPVGLFVNSYGGLCLKTEYGNNEGRIDAYIVESGEFFWGDPPQTIASQRAQLVRPVDLDRVDAALAAPAAKGGTEDDSLDARLKAAGMFTLPEMMGKTPLSRFTVHAGVRDLASFEQWLDRVTEERFRARLAYELGDKSKDDELYEWTFAHSAAFSAVRENFKAALAASPPPPAGAAGGGSGDLAALSAGATPGPWYVESEKTDGTYGAGEDCSEGYDVSTICTEAERPYGFPGVLFESHNSTVSLIEEENDDDRFHVWDAVSKANAQFVVALVNAYRSGRLIEAPTPDLGAQGEPVADGWKLVPAKATRDWAYDLATYRQGRSSTPRCEGPTQADVAWGMDRIGEILAVAPEAPEAPVMAGQSEPGADDPADTRARNIIREAAARIEALGVLNADAILNIAAAVPDARKATDDLVDRFSTALKAKLRASETKYGWQNGWLKDGWRDDCQRELLRHVAKGDPLDVAAYAAFCWHHGWSASAPTPNLKAHGEPVAWAYEELRTRTFDEWEPALSYDRPGPASWFRNVEPLFKRAPAQAHDARSEGGER